MGINKQIYATRKIYKEALRYLVPICNEHWEEIVNLGSTDEQARKIETLVHGTKDTSPVYDFDKQFYKFPSYLRRGAIVAAVGIVKSYRSNLENWENSDKKHKAPKLQINHDKLPTFYQGNMYQQDESTPYRAMIKLFVKNDWVWVKLDLKKTDVDYIKKYWSGVKATAPTLERHHGKFFLRFAFKKNVKLTERPIQEQKICSVDLGINTDATCTIMTSDGTVVARKFISFPTEKDHLWHVLNRVKKFQKIHGSHNVRSFWEYAQRINKELGYKIGSTIADYAYSEGCDVIVFEYLDFHGKKYRGKNKQRLSMWRKNTIQAIAEHKAHLYGMRISRICPWNSSKLAFDGSGWVKRDEDNYALATFKTGKRYNADLNASYNIGARYFFREILKTQGASNSTGATSQKKESSYWANVPDSLRRTSTVKVTLSTLRELNSYRVA